MKMNVKKKERNYKKLGEHKSNDMTVVQSAGKW
jgi:hypothetical protein